MLFDSEELRTGFCSICGEHIGKGFDHTECAKIKKEAFKDRKVKNRHKKLTKKQRENSGKYFSEKGW